MQSVENDERSGMMKAQKLSGLIRRGVEPGWRNRPAVTFVVSVPLRKNDATTEVWNVF